MHPKFLKQAKIMNKCLKNINMMGYMVFLKDGPHHQLMKVERRFKKKKEKKLKEEALVVLGEWTSMVKNQAQAQVMSQTRPSPPASTRARLHHPTYALWLKVWKAM